MSDSPQNLRCQPLVWMAALPSNQLVAHWIIYILENNVPQIGVWPSNMQKAKEFRGSRE
jgi:hypothetical protein